VRVRSVKGGGGRGKKHFDNFPENSMKGTELRTGGRQRLKKVGRVGWSESPLQTEKGKARRVAQFRNWNRGEMTNAGVSSSHPRKKEVQERAR